MGEFGGDDSGVAERGFGREAEHGRQVERVGAGGEGFFEDAVLAQLPRGGRQVLESGGGP